MADSPWSMECHAINVLLRTLKSEKLQVWQIALGLTEKVDYITKAYPRSALFVLTPQIERAADAVALNIAEGRTG